MNNYDYSNVSGQVTYQNQQPTLEIMNAVSVENGGYAMGYSPVQQMNNMPIYNGTNPYGVVPAYYNGSIPSPTSPAQEEFYWKTKRHRMEIETIDHKADRKDANDILKSGLKRQEMYEKAELDEKAMEKKAEIDKEKIVLKEDLRLKKENAVIVVVKNPEREGRLCLQYQNASGKTIVSKPICEAKSVCMHRVMAYAENDTHIAYRFIIDGKVLFYIIGDELTPQMIAKCLKENGYPISFKRNKKDETYTAVFNCLKQECDNYPAEIIPYTEGWNHYTRNGNEHFEFVVPRHQLVFKQLAEEGDVK